MVNLLLFLSGARGEVDLEKKIKTFFNLVFEIKKKATLHLKFKNQSLCKGS